MGHVTGVRLYKTQSSSIYLVLWESYCVVSKTPNLWLSNFSEPLEVPDEVPGVQLSRFEWLKMPGRAWFQWGWKTNAITLLLCLYTLLVFFQDFAWPRWPVSTGLKRHLCLFFPWEECTWHHNFVKASLVWLTRYLWTFQKMGQSPTSGQKNWRRLHGWVQLPLLIGNICFCIHKILCNLLVLLSSSCS